MYYADAKVSTDLTTIFAYIEHDDIQRLDKIDLNQPISLIDPGHGQDDTGSIRRCQIDFRLDPQLDPVGIYYRPISREIRSRLSLDDSFGRC
jgi:hypothetical protein